MELSTVRNIAVFLFAVFVTGYQKLSNEIYYKGPRIVSLYTRSDVVYRFAETVITSTVVNDDYVSREVTFDATLPEAAFISNFTLEIDGIQYPGVVKEREFAQRQYDKAKKKGHTAAHISVRPRDTNKFRVNINIAAQAEVTFVLTYDELLLRKRGQYEHTIYIDPHQVVDKLLVEVYIFESREITALRIPPLRNDILLSNYEITTSNELATVERPSSNTAYIRYDPSPEQQKMSSVNGVSGLFKVQYDIQRSLDAGDIYVVNGYFTHFFAPVGLPPLRKRILFVLDVSGSMSFDRKLTQLKEAMTHILSDLDEEDLFNIITFESTSYPWSEHMKKATHATVADATTFVQKLVAEGGTNVNDALTDGLNILQAVSELQRSDVTAPLIVFLTDGDPTVGVTNFKKILNSIETKNEQKIQIFSLALGGDANFDFLKKLSARNNAFARKIYTDADAPLQLTGFYNEISNVLLSKLSFNYLDSTVNMTTVTQNQFPTFFDGSELVVSGRLAEDDDLFNTLTLSVVGTGQHGIIELSTSANVVNTDRSGTQPPDFKLNFDFETVTERIWAYLTIKKLLEEKLKTENAILKNELKHEALTLALKYNFVTPVTSMVVIKPEEKKMNESMADLGIQDDDPTNGNRDIDSTLGVSALTAPLGPQGLTGKGSALSKLPGLADSDPHFIVRVKGLEYAVCFDVMGGDGDVYQLLKDRYSGLTVNAKVVSNKVKPGQPNMTHKGEIKTFLGEVSIRRGRLNVSVTPMKIRYNGESVPWTAGATFSHGRTKIVVDRAGSMLVVIFHDRIAILVMRHLRPEPLRRAGKVNFLGFYVVDFKGLSYHTHGLLGQFLHRTIILKKTKNRKGKLLGRLRVTGNTRKPRRVMATLGHRLNMATNSTVSCWMVQHNGGGLLDGKITDYLLTHNTRGNTKPRT